MKLFVNRILLPLWAGLRWVILAISRSAAASFRWLAKPFAGHPRLTWILSLATLALWAFEGWSSAVFEKPTTAFAVEFWVGLSFWFAGTVFGPLAIRLIDRKSVGAGSQNRTRALSFTVAVQLFWLGATLLIWLFLIGREGVQSVNTVHGVLASLSLLPSFALSLIMLQRGLRDTGFDADVVLVNKTGTLTTGFRKLKFVELAVGSPLATKNDVVALAAALEPEELDDLSRAIKASMRRRKVEPVEVKDLIDMPGLGYSGRLDGSRVVIGGPAQLVAHNTRIDVVDLVKADAANSQGQTVLYVLKDGVLCGYLGFADELRDDVGFFIKLLQYRRKRVIVYSGDAHETTKYFANELGCTEFFGEVLPHEYDAMLAKVSADGSKILESTDVAATAAQIERAVRDRRFQRAAIFVALLVPGLSLLAGVMRLISGGKASIMMPAILASVGLNLALIIIEVSRRVWRRVPKAILATQPSELSQDD